MAKKNIFDIVNNVNKSNIQNPEGTTYDPAKFEKSVGEIPAEYGGIEELYPTKLTEEFQNFDEYIPKSTVRGGQYSTDDLVKMRAENQSNLEQIGNAGLRFGANVVPQIIGGFASIVDIPGYFDAESGASNSIVKAVADWKASTSEALPIYLENPDTPLDLGDFAWWMDRGEGLAESVASFVAQGAGVGKLASVGLKGLSTALGAKKLATLAGIGAESQQIAAKGLNTLASATMLNQSEATIEASSVYHDTIDYWKGKGATDEDAKKQAAIAASTTYNINRANILLNLSSAHAFLQPMKMTRQLLSPNTIGKTLGELTKEGSQEALEELINHSASQAGKAHGKGESYGFAEAMKDMKSAEGLESAILGAFGGIAQTGGTSLYNSTKLSGEVDLQGNRISKNALELQKYNDQQKIIEDLKSTGVRMSDAFMNMKDTIALQDDIQKYAAEGNQEMYDQTTNKLLENQALKHFKAGTTEVLEKMIKSVQSEEGSQDMGITNDTVNNTLSKLKQLETIYNNYEGYSNVEELFYNRANKLRSEDNISKLKQEQIISRNDLQNTIDRIAKKYSFENEQQIPIKENGKVIGTESKKVNEPIDYSISNLENNTGTTEENKKQYENFLNELKQTSAYQNNQQYQEQIDKGESFVLGLDKQFTSLTSKEGQQEAIKQKEERLQNFEHVKTINSSESSISDLENIINTSNNSNTKQLAKDKIDELKIVQQQKEQQKKEDIIFRDKANKIKDVNNKEELENLKSEINNTLISETNRKQLADLIEKREIEIESGLGSDSLIEKPTNDELKDAEIYENKVNSELPSDFNNTETESNIIKEIDELSEKLIEQNNIPSVDEKGNPVWDYKRTNEGYNKAAYLARDFVQIDGGNGIITREEINNKLNDINPDLLDPEKLKSGHKIKLIEDFDYDGDIYISNSTTKEKIKWSDRKKKIKNNSELLENETPIVALDSITGEKLFYIHDTNWITEENIDATAEEIENDLQLLKLIRSKVLSSGSEGVETKINNKTSGILFKTADKKSILLENAMPDENLIISIGKDDMYIGNSIPKEQIIGSENIKDGYGYSIIPVGEKFMAIPLERTLLSNEIVETITQAVKAYLTISDATSINLVRDIAKSTGHDISNITELGNFIRKFTYLFPIEGNTSLKQIIVNETKEFDSSNRLISVTGNSIEFGKPSVIGSFRSLSQDTPVDKLESILNDLRKHLSESLTNIEKNALLKKENISFIDQENNISTIPYFQYIKQNYKTNVLSTKIETKNGSKYVYTYQQGIIYDTTFVGIENKEVFQSQVSNLADQEYIENQAKLIANNKLEYSIDRIYQQLEDLENGFYNEFKTSLFQEPSQEEINNLISIRERAIEIRNEEENKPVIPIKKTLSDGEIIEIKENDIDISENNEEDYDIDDLPNLTDDTVNSIEKEINKLIIKGLSTPEQDSLINYISSSINTAAIKQKEEGIFSSFDPNPIFEQKKKSLQERSQLYKDHNLPNKAAKIDLILNQFDKVKKLTNEYIKLIITGKVSNTEISNNEINEDLIISDEISGGLENTVHSDDWTLTTDSKETISADLKRFFSFIENKENGLTKKNDLGFSEIIPFDIVYNTLHEILAGLPADYNLIEKRLIAYNDFFPWLQSVVEKLDETTTKIRNEFVVDMTKHAIKMRFVMWTQNKNGSYSLIDQDANSSSTQKRLITQWTSNIKSTDNPGKLIIVNENGDHIFDKEKANILIAQAEEWKKNIKLNEPDIDSVKQWLSNFGILIDSRTLKDLQDGKFRNNGKVQYSGLFNQSNGLIKVLSDKLKNSINFDKTLDESKILIDSVVRSLAMMDSIYVNNVFSNSFNAGGKTIYTFTNNKFVVNRVRDLSETDSEGNLINTKLIDDLKNISFSQYSFWLNDLTNENKELSIAFKEQFGIDYLSLEALKKQFTSSKDNRKLNNLNNDEHEVIKLALFFNNSGKVYNGETRRKVSFFYPTMSDKSSMMLINTLSNEVHLNEDNSLSDISISKLYDAIVLPEIQRIVSKQATNVNGYKPNIFYFIPTLNDKSITINNKEKTILQHIQDGNLDDVKESINDEIRLLFDKLLQNKKEEWNKLNIGTIDKQGYSFINNDYMINIAKGSKEDKINYAASDYIFNSLISNSENFKLIIGDPAQYAKFKNNKSINENLEDTFINIGKRLAADIAPGIELADSENNKYYQVFLNDKKLASKQYNQGLQKVLNPEVLEKYKSIEGSDAQEYTTWKEHLYVMKQLGKLTDSQFNRMSDRLSKGLGLSFDDLQTVLQPMKPVYVGNQIDRNENIDKINISPF